MPSYQISIHASRGGSDLRQAFQLQKLYISIHASRGGSDFLKRLRKALSYQFQSTLPAGEATLRQAFQLQKLYISIHASRGGSDHVANQFAVELLLFQSTLPAGEATVRSSCPLMTARSSMGSANRDFPVFLSAVSMLFFFWALGVRAYRIMVSLGSYPFFVPI